MLRKKDVKCSFNVIQGPEVYCYREFAFCNLKVCMDQKLIVAYRTLPVPHSIFGLEGKVLIDGLKCPLCGHDGSFGFVGCERKGNTYWYYIYACPVCDERFLRKDEGDE